jgi:hypothetical protein
MADAAFHGEVLLRHSFREQEGLQNELEALRRDESQTSAAVMTWPIVAPSSAVSIFPVIM